MLIFLGQVQFTLGLSLRSEVGIGSKPDGCALIVSPPPCRIVAEVELTSHPFTPPMKSSEFIGYCFYHYYEIVLIWKLAVYYKGI
jgi:hypothetical protein